MSDLNAELRSELTSVAHAMAEAARAAILPHFRSHLLRADNKEAQGFDPVTQADRAAEQAMRAVLKARRPDDAILGEEFGAHSGSTGLTWVLDPIDGTRGFLSGTPTWGVLIGLLHNERAVFGVLDQPYTRERWTGGWGEGQFVGPLGQSALRVRDTANLSDAILFSTFPEVGTQHEQSAFQHLSQHVKLTRYGTDCYAYGLVALGQIDLVVEAGLQSYDICALIAVIEAAGGLVTDWEGARVEHGGRVLAAANPTLHAAAIGWLKRGV